MTWKRSPLTRAIILGWADDHRQRTGKYPHADSGLVLANLNESWQNINQALRLGLRTLTGKDSLAKLLKRERGLRTLTGKDSSRPARM